MALDTASIYYRAFFALPTSLTAADGTPVNAVRGLAGIIARLVKEHSPTTVVAAWDNDWRPQFRVDAISSYKAHRVAAAPDADSSADGQSGAHQLDHSPAASNEDTPDELDRQVPIIVELLECCGIPIVGVDGFEADDVLASVAEQAVGACDVVTGDRDLFQLIDDAAAVRVLYLTTKTSQPAQVWNNARLREAYGIDAHQYIDFAILRGDPSDGLPGVRGIGEKTAATLLGQWGDLDRIRAAAETEGQLTARLAAAIRDASGYLDAAPTVVTARRDLPVNLGEESRAYPAERQERFQQLANQWNLGSAANSLWESLHPEVR